MRPLLLTTGFEATMLSLHEEGLSYRLIARKVGLSENTVKEIVRRHAPVA
jgi:DNA-binding NarL/FixJ family response regulator